MMNAAMSGVTIGQAAAFVGVTVKTVRHYHKLGVVEEPRRDGSGYRRYGSADLLRLVQVRTLAGAGVPLAEIGPCSTPTPTPSTSPPSSPTSSGSSPNGSRT